MAQLCAILVIWLKFNVIEYYETRNAQRNVLIYIQFNFNY